MRGLYNAFLIFYAGVRDGDVWFGVVWMERGDIWERVETFASRPRLKRLQTQTVRNHIFQTSGQPKQFDHPFPFQHSQS